MAASSDIQKTVVVTRAVGVVRPESLGKWHSRCVWPCLAQTSSAVELGAHAALSYLSLSVTMSDFFKSNLPGAAGAAGKSYLCAYAMHRL